MSEANPQQLHHGVPALTSTALQQVLTPRRVRCTAAPSTALRVATSVFPIPLPPK